MSTANPPPTTDHPSSNPKLAGSNLIDCIPQTGECPLDCDECFYNSGRFYRTLDEPLLPTEAEVGEKIVRVNSGHDSNLQSGRVIETTQHYSHKFYNTSIPDFGFPGPVVFTCNGRRPLMVECPENVMFVRIRCNTWDDIQYLVKWYAGRQGVPVVLTFMRYYGDEAAHGADTPIPTDCGDYEFRTHVSNAYWCPTPEAQVRMMRRYTLADTPSPIPSPNGGRGQDVERLTVPSGSQPHSSSPSQWGRIRPPAGGKGQGDGGIRMCGTPWSSYCRDCRNCEFYYWETMRRMGRCAIYSPV